MNSKLTPISGCPRKGRLVMKRLTNNVERAKPHLLKDLRDLKLSKCSIVN